MVCHLKMYGFDTFAGHVIQFIFIPLFRWGVEIDRFNGEYGEFQTCSFVFHLNISEVGIL